MRAVCTHGADTPSCNRVPLQDAPVSKRDIAGPGFDSEHRRPGYATAPFLRASDSSGFRMGNRVRLCVCLFFGGGGLRQELTMNEATIRCNPGPLYVLETNNIANLCWAPLVPRRDRGGGGVGAQSNIQTSGGVEARKAHRALHSAVHCKYYRVPSSERTCWPSLPRCRGYSTPCGRRPVRHRPEAS